MDFCAYPAVPHVGSKSRALCKAQSLLRGNDSVVLPCALLCAAVLAVLYEHATMDQRSGYNDGAIRNFLAMITITMVPLAFLEKKILACTDPVTLISKFSSHVLLLHACFLAARVHSVFLSSGLFTTAMLIPMTGFCVAGALLLKYFGLRCSRSFFAQYREALVVLCVAFAAAVLTEGIDEYRRPAWRRGGLVGFLKAAGDAGALYVELLAFVPAVWMVCRPKAATASHSTPTVNVVDTRARAIAFFSFLLAFYFTEDVLSAFSLMRDLPLAALGHTAHYLLLLDFAGFLLVNLYDPDKLDKLMGSLRNLFTDACAV